MPLKKTTFPYYQVKKGENLKTVAKKFGVDSTKILLDNQISPRMVKEGVFLVIRKD